MYITATNDHGAVVVFLTKVCWNGPSISDRFCEFLRGESYR